MLLEFKDTYINY